MNPKYCEVAVGQQIGRWTVLRAPEKHGSRWLATCLCSCGSQRPVDARNLARRKSLSCGCARSETTAARSTRHGCTTRSNRTRLYKIWAGMLARCRDESCPGYGASGIDVCPEWYDFTAFKAWADSTGYRDELTIDRIDGKGGYSPDNCRWATPTTQRRNQARNTMLTAFGETKTLADWAEDPRCKTNQRTLRMRTKRGWGTEDAIAHAKTTRWSHKQT